MTDYKNLKLIATSNPHIRGSETTRSIMLDVIIALLPAVVVGVINFGAAILLPIATSVASAVFFEWAYRKFMKKPDTIGDLTAVLTGLLMAMTMPPQAPWWMPIIGTFFGIVVVKQLYGGIGKNFVNPALAARAFLLASYPAYVSRFPMPRTMPDAVSMATPLSVLYEGGTLESYSLQALLTGNIPGCTGEISAIALLLGGAYLLNRKVISWHIPASYIGTVFVLSFLMGFADVPRLEWATYNVLTGGLMLGALFMATDYVTSPVMSPAKLVYGCGCGVLTVLIHYFGGYPEGVSYAILLMNLVAWPLDKAFRRRPFGAPEKPKRRLFGKKEAAHE